RRGGAPWGTPAEARASGTCQAGGRFNRPSSPEYHEPVSPPADALHLIVTTGKRPTQPLVRRARAVAATCGVAYVSRDDSLPRLLRRHGADGAYVLTSDTAEVRARGARLGAHPSTAHLNLARGRAHPLLRAIA